MSQNESTEVVFGPTLKASEVPPRVKIVLGKPFKSAIVHEAETVDIRPPKMEGEDGPCDDTQ